MRRTQSLANASIFVESLDLVGSHGQTIYHEGPRNTLQIGEASVIAERLGVPVVSDFRTRDIAAGGQGAPLVPFVDALLFSSTATTAALPSRDREGAVRSAPASIVALNIGGIANITILPAGIAFDTGPTQQHGDRDQLVERLTKRKTALRPQRRNRNSTSTARSSLHRPPTKPAKRNHSKTVGREQYGSTFVDSLAATGLSLEDLIATATALTAATIAAAIPLPQAR